MATVRQDNIGSVRSPSISINSNPTGGDYTRFMGIFGSGARIIGSPITAMRPTTEPLDTLPRLRPPTNNRRRPLDQNSLTAFRPAGAPATSMRRSASCGEGRGVCWRKICARRGAWPIDRITAVIQLASGWYGIFELAARIACRTPKTRGRASRDASGAWVPRLAWESRMDPSSSQISRSA